MAAGARADRPRPARRAAVALALSACGRLPLTRDDRHLRGRVRCQRALPERRAADLRGPDLAPAEPFEQRRLPYLQGLDAGAAQARTRPGVVRGVPAGLQRHHQTQLLASNQITLTDTQGNIYRAVVPSPTNLFAYRGGSSRRKASSRSPARRPRSASQGQLLLFKIQTSRSTTARSRSRSSNPKNPSTARQAELDV